MYHFCSQSMDVWWNPRGSAAPRTCCAVSSVLFSGSRWVAWLRRCFTEREGPTQFELSCVVPFKLSNVRPGLSSSTGGRSLLFHGRSKVRWDPLCGFKRKGSSFYPAGCPSRIQGGVAALPFDTLDGQAGFRYSLCGELQVKFKASGS